MAHGIPHEHMFFDVDNVADKAAGMPRPVLTVEAMARQARPDPAKACGVRIRADIAAAHRQRWPERRPTTASRTWLLATSPVLRLLIIQRWRQWLHTLRQAGGGRGLLALAGRAALVLPKWLAQVIAKSQINNDSEIDGGVRFSERGQIFFGATHIGAGSVVGYRVTVGSSHVDNGCPRIGSNVWIGPNCVLYGAIRIGDGATLLPGTVLTKSIPAHAVVQGNPARLVRRHYDNAALRALGEDAALACAVKLAED